MAEQVKETPPRGGSEGSDGVPSEELLAGSGPQLETTARVGSESGKGDAQSGASQPTATRRRSSSSDADLRRRAEHGHLDELDDADDDDTVPPSPVQTLDYHACSVCANKDFNPKYKCCAGCETIWCLRCAGGVQRVTRKRVAIDTMASYLRIRVPDFREYVCPDCQLQKMSNYAEGVIIPLLSQMIMNGRLEKDAPWHFGVDKSLYNVHMGVSQGPGTDEMIQGNIGKEGVAVAGSGESDVGGRSTSQAAPSVRTHGPAAAHPLQHPAPKLRGGLPPLPRRNEGTRSPPPVPARIRSVPGSGTGIKMGISSLSLQVPLKTCLPLQIRDRDVSIDSEEHNIPKNSSNEPLATYLPQGSRKTRDEQARNWLARSPSVSTAERFALLNPSTRSASLSPSSRSLSHSPDRSRQLRRDSSATEIGSMPSLVDMPTEAEGKSFQEALKKANIGQTPRPTSTERRVRREKERREREGDGDRHARKLKERQEWEDRQLALKLQEKLERERGPSPPPISSLPAGPPGSKRVRNTSGQTPMTFYPSEKTVAVENWLYNHFSGKKPPSLATLGQPRVCPRELEQKEVTPRNSDLEVQKKIEQPESSLTGSSHKLRRLSSSPGGRFPGNFLTRKLFGNTIRPTKEVSIEPKSDDCPSTISSSFKQLPKSSPLERLWNVNVTPKTEEREQKPRAYSPTALRRATRNLAEDLGLELSDSVCSNLEQIVITQGRKVGLQKSASKSRSCAPNSGGGQIDPSRKESSRQSQQGAGEQTERGQTGWPPVIPPLNPVAHIATDALLEQNRLTQQRIEQISSAVLGARASLPSVPLPVFSGQVLMYSNWRTQFLARMDQAGYSDEIKMQALLTCLKGKAYDKVVALGASKDGWSLSMQLLDNRFGNIGYCIQKCEDQIRALPEVAVDKSNLESFLDSLISSVTVLCQSDSVSEERINSLSRVVLSKLPDSLVNSLSRKLYQQDPQASVYSISLLDLVIPRLKEELAAQKVKELCLGVRRDKSEKSSSSSRGWPSRNTGTTRDFRSKSRDRNDSFGRRLNENRYPHEQKASALFKERRQPSFNFQSPRKESSGNGNSPTMPKWDGTCCFCLKGVHNPVGCRLVKSPDERREVVKAQGLCFICLGKNCQAATCKRKQPCAVCAKLSHHTSLCQSFTNPRKNPAKHVTFQKSKGGRTQLNFNRSGDITLQTESECKINNEAEKKGPPKDLLPGQISNDLALIGNRGKCGPCPGGWVKSSASERESKERYGTFYFKNPGVQMLTQKSQGSDSSALLTFTAYLRNPHFPSLSRKVFVLCDTGASTSCVDESYIKHLQLPVLDESMYHTSTFGRSDTVPVTFKKVEVSLCGANGFCMSIYINGISQVCPSIDLYPAEWSRQERKEIEDNHPGILNMPPIQTKRMTVDLILGMDLLVPLLYGPDKPVTKLKSDGSLVIIHSPFGRLLAGALPDIKVSRKQVKQNAMVLNSRLESRLNDLYQLEAHGLSAREIRTTADEAARKIFQENLTRDESGRYLTALPFCADPVALPHGRGIALKRLRNLWKQLTTKDTALLKTYDDLIKTYINAGTYEIVNEKDPPLGQIHVLSHFPVFKQNSQHTQCRQVLDPAQKQISGESLNNYLYKGENLLVGILDVIMNSRFRKWQVCCDLAKAFHGILLAPKFRDFQRLLWLKKPTLPPTEDNILCLRATSVSFGEASSPFILLGVLMNHYSLYDSPLARELESNSYMDNLSYTVEDLEDAKAKYKEIKSMFQDCQMNIREFVSNLPGFMETVPEADQGKLEDTRFLGLTWDLKLDCYGITKFPDCRKATNKRGVISAYSAVWDPLQLVSPVVMLAKFFYRKLTDYRLPSKKEGGDPVPLMWNDPIPPQWMEEWKDIAENLNSLRGLQYPRKVVQYPKLPVRILVFGDASCKGHAAVAYVHQELPGPFKCSEQPQHKGKEGSTQCANPEDCLVAERSSCHLLTCKACTNPQGLVDIPKIELVSVEKCAILVAWLRKSLPKYIKILEIIVYTDSEVALHWLLADSHKNQFVRNRCRNIRNLAKDNDFMISHHPGISNPADIPSKAWTYQELIQPDNWNWWWTGPKWTKKGRRAIWRQPKPNAPRLEEDESEYRGRLRVDELDDQSVRNPSPPPYSPISSCSPISPFAPISPGSPTRVTRVSHTPSPFYAASPTASGTSEEQECDDLVLKTARGNIVPSKEVFMLICNWRKNLDANDHPGPFGIKCAKLVGNRSLRYLLGITAYARRFVNRLKGRQTPKTTTLEPAELKEATVAWIKSIQQYYFQDTLSRLKKDRKRKEKGVPGEKGDKLMPQSKWARDLAVQLDKRGILRVLSRFHKSQFTELGEPILLPGQHPFTALVIQNAHKEAGHWGPEITYSTVRRQGYYIQSWRTHCKAILRECYLCRRFKGSPFGGLTFAPFKEDKLSTDVAFKWVGYDIHGPCLVYADHQKDGKGQNKKRVTTKAYYMVYSCLVCRAIECELMPDHSGISVVNALTRIASRRGWPKKVYTDYGSALLAAQQYVIDRCQGQPPEGWSWVHQRKALQQKGGCGLTFPTEDLSYMTSFLAEKNVMVSHSAPYHPSSNGINEIAVKLVGKVLATACGNKTLEMDHARTLLASAAAVCNLRPLFYLNRELGEAEIVVPAHFIAPSTRLLLPPSFAPEAEGEDPDWNQDRSQVPTILRICEKRLQKVWKVFHELLPATLEEERRRRYKDPPGAVMRAPSVGEVCLIKRAKTKHGSYDLCRILELSPTRDNRELPRVAKVLKPNGNVTLRSVTSLVPLAFEAPPENREGGIRGTEERGDLGGAYLEDKVEHLGLEDGDGAGDGRQGEQPQQRTARPDARPAQPAPPPARSLTCTTPSASFRSTSRTSSLGLDLGQDWSDLHDDSDSDEDRERYQPQKTAERRQGGGRYSLRPNPKLRDLSSLLSCQMEGCYDEEEPETAKGQRHRKRTGSPKRAESKAVDHMYKVSDEHSSKEERAARKMVQLYNRSDLVEIPDPNRWLSKGFSGSSPGPPIRASSRFLSSLRFGTLGVMLCCLLTCVQGQTANNQTSNATDMELGGVELPSHVHLQLCMNSHLGGRPVQLPKTPLPCQLKSGNKPPVRTLAEVYVPTGKFPTTEAVRCHWEITQAITQMSFVGGKGILNDLSKVRMEPISDPICRLLWTTKVYQGQNLTQLDHRTWTTNRPLVPRYVWCCKNVLTEVRNVVLITGAVSLVSAEEVGKEDKLVSDLGTLSGCQIEQASCGQSEYMIVWKSLAFASFCPYEKKTGGPFKALIQGDNVVITKLQAAMTISYAEKLTSQKRLSCLPGRIHHTREGIALLFLDHRIYSHRNIINQKWTGDGNKKGTWGWWVGGNGSKDNPETKVREDHIVSIQGYPFPPTTPSHPRPSKEKDPENVRLNYLLRTVEKDLQDRFAFLFHSYCRLAAHQMRITLALIRLDPTEGIRVLTGNEGTVTRMSFDMAYISKCQTINITRIFLEHRLPGNPTCWRFLPVIDQTQRVYFLPPHTRDLMTYSPEISCHEVRRATLPSLSQERAGANNWEAISGKIWASQTGMWAGEPHQELAFDQPPLYHSRVAVPLSARVGYGRAIDKLQFQVGSVVSYLSSSSTNPSAFKSALQSAGDMVLTVAQAARQGVRGLVNSDLKELGTATSSLVHPLLHVITTVLTILLVIGVAVAAIWYLAMQPEIRRWARSAWNWIANGCRKIRQTVPYRGEREAGPERTTDWTTATYTWACPFPWARGRERPRSPSGRATFARRRPDRWSESATGNVPRRSRPARSRPPHRDEVNIIAHPPPLIHAPPEPTYGNISVSSDEIVVIDTGGTYEEPIRRGTESIDESGYEVI